MSATSLPRFRLFAVTASTFAAGALGVAVPGCETISTTVVGVSEVRVSPGASTIVVDGAAQFEAQPLDDAGRLLLDRAVTWSTGDLTIASVSASGLVRAHRSGSVSVRATAEGVTGLASVEVVVPPTIALSTDEIRLIALPGGVAGPAYVDLIGVGHGALTGLRAEVEYHAPSGVDWLFHEISSTQTPATVTLRASAEGLAPGRHAADVRIRAEGPVEIGATVTVLLDVGVLPPSIAVDLESVGFAVDEGGPPPPAQSVRISNGGGGALEHLTADVRYASPGSPAWLAIDLDRPEAPAELTLRPRDLGLSVGVYDAVVAVASPSAGGTAQVQVRLRVGDPPPRIALATSAITVEVLEDRIVGRSIAIDNAGSGNLTGLAVEITHPVGEPDSWLVAELAAPSAPSELLLAIMTAGLSPGSYSATVSVSSTTAINSPQMVEVDLEVVSMVASAATTTIDATPGEIVADGSSTALVTVVARNAAGEPVGQGGDSVGLATTAGTLGPVVDEGDGTYSAVLTAPADVGAATVTGTLNDVPIVDSARVDFVAPPPPVGSAKTTTIDVTPTTIVRPLTTTATVRVVVNDEAGNPLGTGGDLVQLTATAGTIGPITDGSDGTYTATFTAPVGSATVTITGTLNGEPIGDTARVDVVGLGPLSLESPDSAASASTPTDSGAG